jgi:hypothetical protein
MTQERLGAYSGKTLASYQLHELVGKGGGAEVYRGTAQQFGHRLCRPERQAQSAFLVGRCRRKGARRPSPAKPKEDSLLTIYEGGASSASRRIRHQIAR